MPQVVSIVSLFLFVLVTTQDAHGQQTNNRVRGWLSGQQEASVTLAALQLREIAAYNLDGAFGERAMGIEADVAITPHPFGVMRTVNGATVDGQRLDAETGRRRRGMRSPLRRDLQRTVDRLLFPLGLLDSLEVMSDPAPDRLDGAEVVRIRLGSPDRDGPFESVSAYFDGNSGPLLGTRAIIRGPDRGTLLVEVRYARIEGLDLPISRTIEGSFGVRRRTRSFTVLLDSSARYELLDLASL